MTKTNNTANRGTRIKHTTPVISTRGAAEAALGEVARLTIERNTKQLAMEKGLLAIREDFETDLASLQKQIDAQAELLKGWAEANPEEFGKLKSVDMQHGSLGWRQSTKLKTLAKWTWDRVLELLRNHGRVNFVRTKEEVNKDAIRDAAMGGDLDAETLKAMGMRLAVEDTFFVEPRLEQVENRVVATATAMRKEAA